MPSLRTLCRVIAAAALAQALVAHAAERPAGDGGQPPPDKIDGLVAWYQVETLHRTQGHGAVVREWRDSSGNGHTLTDDGTGLPAELQAPGAATRPHVLVRKGNTYSVEKPFAFEDHTIVLVYAADQPARAFFRSDLDPGHGVVLRANARRDQVQLGSSMAGKTFAYGQAVGRSAAAFDVTILARRQGVLRQFENGVDVSSGVEVKDPLRVGKLFGLENTRYSKSDGDGLRIAEMLFYDRYLETAEREALLAWIASRHDLELGARRDELPAPDDRTHRVRLKTDRAATLGQIGTGADGEAVVRTATVAWNVQDAAVFPFRHDAEGSAERLRCARDGTRVELTVVLPVVAEGEGVSLRVLLLKNGEEYLAPEAQSGLLPTSGQPAIVRLAAQLELGEDDYITVVTVPAGPQGSTARLVPEGARLIVPGP